MAERNRKPDQPKLHGGDADVAQQRAPHAGGGQQHPTHPHPGATAHRHATAGGKPGTASGDVPEHVRSQPDKGDPVIRAGDAGGPNDGRNITTADLDHDAGKPDPNVMEQSAYAAKKPKHGKPPG
jgi:hypothetical protein